MIKISSNASPSILAGQVVNNLNTSLILIQQGDYLGFILDAVKIIKERVVNKVEFTIIHCREAQTLADCLDEFPIQNFVNSNGILLLDKVDKANKNFVKEAVRLSEEGKYIAHNGEYEVPSGWRIVIGVSELPTAPIFPYSFLSKSFIMAP